MAAKLTLPTRRNTKNHRSWHGTAFIMESLILVVFLVVSTTILMQVFSASRTHSDRASSLSFAAILAANEAERFTAHPTGNTTNYYAVEQGTLAETDETDQNTYKVSCSTRQQRETNGVLYYATITVEYGDETVYVLNSARYLGT